MKSKLITPSGKEFPNIKYYDFYMAAKQIVEMYIEKDEKLKKDFLEFSRNYHFYEPYLDFLITKLNFSIKSPFIDDDGLLFSKNNKLYYYTDYNIKDTNPVEYPFADDISLRIRDIDYNDIRYSIMDLNNNISYDLIRTKGDFHGKILSVILLQNASKNKVLYEDYDKYINDDGVDTYRSINSYFRMMFDYVQVVKYDDGSGHLIYNDTFLTDEMRDVLMEIKNANPKMKLDKEYVEDDLYYDVLNRRKTLNKSFGRTI